MEKNTSQFFVSYFKKIARNLKEVFPKMIVKNVNGYYLVLKFNKKDMDKNIYHAMQDTAKNGYVVQLNGCTYVVTGAMNSNKEFVFEQEMIENNKDNYVSITYPANYFMPADLSSKNHPDKLIAKEMKAFKAKKSGSGIGFGERDINFIVPTQHVSNVLNCFKTKNKYNFFCNGKEIKVSVYPNL